MMRILILLQIAFLLGCSKDLAEQTLFTEIAEESGVTFRNELTFTEQLNPYTYRNFYNGAGVALGDINNDGLLDIYFAGNQVDNKLYLNEGNLKFRDISETAGVSCKNVWCTGVTFADINADGLLDIYVCKSGDPEAANRHNELFINNGDLTFTERAKEYGLDVVGLSVQAAFFDYDKDGDLDCYLLTNSFKSVGNFDLVRDQRKIPDPSGGGNKFFVNDNGKFRDSSKEAGIYSSTIGFGLGITLGDFNNDSWIDIFLSNDFFERDYLYINDQHGAFNESLPQYFNSISMGSMGADFADLDNDGYSELFVTEMLPDSLSRRKTKTVFESWSKYQLNIQNGYYHQFSRNVLQKRTGNNNYAELGRLAGAAASEWSWGALLFDMDNDGRRDIFVANGIYKDLLDRDYLTYTGAQENVRKIIREEKNAIIKLIDLMPSSKFSNYAFKNAGNLNFTDVAAGWGLATPMFSSGSAYGDLDNDGDADLVVNNINSPSVLYRNNSDSSRFKNISIVLHSGDKNTFSVGSKVAVFCGESAYFSDNFVTRGFQSSVQPKMTIGLGENVKSIDSLLITWPDGRYSVMYHIPVNQILEVYKEKVNFFECCANKDIGEKKPQIELISRTLFTHKGSGLNEFNRDRLIPFMYGNETPAMLKADINGDEKEEIYIGGGKDQAGLFIQLDLKDANSFTSKAISKYSLAEETNGSFVDVDSDGDLDFCMAVGGRFFPKTSSVLMNRIFLNNGKGDFSESPYPLPISEFMATSIIKSIDYDNDGDSDLLIGERFDPFTYGMGGRAYLLENDGKGLFKDVTKKVAPLLLTIGMITDAVVEDIDQDQWKDIIIVGDWMPVVILKNKHKKFESISSELGLKGTEGWWHNIESGDFNKDGRIDFVIGNHGLNTFFKVNDRMYVADFDENGSVEQVFCTKINNKYYPVVDKDEFLSQLPSLKKSLLYYKDYAKKSIDELFPKTILDKAEVFEVKKLSSVLLLSDPTGYKQIDLPIEAQYSSIYGILILDFDQDGTLDIIVGGNQDDVKPQFGRYDGSNGWLFKGKWKDNQFTFQPGISLNVKGQIRDIKNVKINGTEYLLFAKYDDDLEIYKIHH